MLTLTPHKDNIVIAHMRTGKKTVPIMWHPVVKEELRNSVDDLGSFFTQPFRDRFELSEDQSHSIQNHLVKNEVCEKNQSKYFKCKTAIQESLTREMDIADTDSSFEIHFPPGSDTWGCLHLCVSSSGGGKTYAVKERVLENLNGPKKDRRKFYWFSPEWNIDETVSELKDTKYRENVFGIDISDDSVEKSEYGTPEEFFKAEVETRIKHASPGSVIIADDPMDASPGVAVPLRNLINKMQRVSRHKKIALIFILPSIRSGIWSSQASNSCRFFTLFPRSQKGKIIEYLNRDLGMRLPEARRAVHDFAASGRQMTVRIHAPQALIGPKLIRLL